MHTVFIAALVVLCGLVASSPAFAQGSAVGGFQQIGERRITRTITEYTYRAGLTNAGGPIASATATAVSLSPATTIVDATLSFGAAGAGATVASSDTFSFRHDRSVPFDWANLQWTINVVAANGPPIANAGPDQTASPGATVTLNGSASSDPDGDPLTFTWTFQSVPAGSGASLSDPTSVSPAFTLDLPGTYSIQLVVHDGVAASVPDVVIVSTQNSAPVADAGPDQTVLVGQTVSLDGSGSSDVDGNPLTFAWSFLSRPPGSAAVLSDPAAVSPTFVADRPGSYLLQLVVHDGTAGSTPDTVAITTQNSAPVANAGADQSVFVGNVVTLDGSGSTDVDGNPLTYAWSLTSVPSGSGAALSSASAVMPTFTADRPGTYVAQLMVNDGTATSAADTAVITTQNSPPVADAGFDHTVVVGQVVLLSGAGSSDADGDALSFQWSFTSVPPGSTAALVNPTSIAPSFTADRPGTYVVQLIVSDGFAASAPDTVTITTTNSVPVANAGPDEFNVLLGSTVTLDGSGSTDPDGHSLTYQWSLLSQPAGSTAALSGATAVGPTFVADVAGVYVAQLVVSDGIQSSAPDTVTVTVAIPVVTIAAVDDGAEAGPETGTFNVSRTGSMAAALTVHYSIAGLATNGVDYVTIPATVTIPAGSASASVTITPIDDGAVEGAESVVLTLSANSAYAVGASGMASVTIADNDVAVVTVVASDPEASEIGPDPGVFTFSRSGGNVSAALVVFFSHGGTATEGVDYASLGGAMATVTIPAGEATATVTITPTDDFTAEGNETVVLTLVDAAAYDPGTPATASVTILDRQVSVVNVTASDATSSEAGGNAGEFTVTRTLTTSALTVDYTIGGTASNGTDYTAIAASVTFAAGQATATITVEPIVDTLIEGTETVIIALVDGTQYNVGSQTTATVTIADAPIPVITIAATDAAAGEDGSDTGVFTITRTGDLTLPLTVARSVGGTATSGVDFTAVGATTIIPAGQASATVTIAPIGDLLPEGAETVVLTIVDGAEYDVGPPHAATVTIADDDLATVTVHATDASAAESGSDTGTFTFTRSGNTSVALTIDIAVSGTATVGTDYANTVGIIVTFGNGQASVTRTVTPVLDALVEGNETVIVTITPRPGDYIVGTPGNATVTIADHVPTVTVSATDAAASESGDTGTFTFTRTGDLGVGLTVFYTVGGTAATGVDYSNTLGVQLTFSSGQATVTRTVSPTLDAVIEGDETVTIALDPGEYVIGTPNAGTVTISDSVGTVTVTATDSAAAESGPDTGTFTFTRTGDLGVALTVFYTVGGTAVAGVDYSNILSTQIQFNSGQATATRTVTPLLDALIEGNETVTITLTPGEYVIGSPSAGVVTIADSVPTITLSATDAAADEATGGTGTFTFTRTGDLGVGLTVFYTVGGTATAGVDYSNTLSTQIQFASGQATVTRTVTPFLDALVEGNETVTMTLTAGEYIIGTPGAGTVTITDSVPTVAITATDASASEAGTDTGTFTFTRTGPTGVSLVVTYTVGGTAIAGSDYSNTLSTQIQFSAGQASVTRTVTPTLDAVLEGDETVTITLTAGEYVIGSPGAATVTIADHVPIVSVEATDADASETGGNTGTFTFTRTGDVGVALTVNYVISGTAIAGTDYSNTLSTLVSFAAGQTTVTRTVTPTNDTTVEGPETVILTLAAGQYVIGTPSATVTITSDE